MTARRLADGTTGILSREECRRQGKIPVSEQPCVWQFRPTDKQVFGGKPDNEL